MQMPGRMHRPFHFTACGSTPFVMMMMVRLRVRRGRGARRRRGTLRAPFRAREGSQGDFVPGCLGGVRELPRPAL